MSTVDLQEFIQEVLTRYDPTINTSSGSLADTKIIQPILRRIGPDPFTSDLRTFITTRLSQELPELSINEGDAAMDLVVKACQILLEPLQQEIQRISNISFKDPSTLTYSEAESLGANFFTTRKTGEVATLVVRLYFRIAQTVVITPENYCYTASGLKFVPTAIQSIPVNTMLFNLEGSLYYFDVSTTAEDAGAMYNIEPYTIIGIYGVPSAVNVANKVRAVNGADAQTKIGRASCRERV